MKENTEFFSFNFHKRTYGVDDGIESVGEILEKQILLSDGHSKNSVEKFGHVIVTFV